MLGSRQRTDFNGRVLQELIASEGLVYRNQGQFTYTDARNGSMECLDVVLVSADLLTRCKDVIKLDDIGSDHIPIGFDLACKPIRNQKSRTPKFKYSQADWDLFRAEIEQGLLTLEENEDPNGNWTS